MNELLLRLRPRQRRGSKPRCHVLMHYDPARRAATLTELVSPWATVNENDVCMPNGFRDIEEVQFHTASNLLDDEVRHSLMTWWLAVGSPKATTPNWDIASRCTIGNTRGLLLIEAKLHRGELRKEEGGKSLNAPVSVNSMRNHVRIGACLEEASIALTKETERPWALSREHQYRCQIDLLGPGS